MASTRIPPLRLKPGATRVIRMRSVLPKSLAPLAPCGRGVGGEGEGKRLLLGFTPHPQPLSRKGRGEKQCLLSRHPVTPRECGGTRQSSAPVPPAIPLPRPSPRAIRGLYGPTGGTPTPTPPRQGFPERRKRWPRVPSRRDGVQTASPATNRRRPPLG